MSYVEFLIRSNDLPSIDYENKKNKKGKKKKQKLGFGTPISDLPLDVQKQIKP